MFEQLNFGGVGEWLKPAVLKTVRPQKGLVGSNPTPSASQSGRFSLLVPFGQNCRFCAPKGMNATWISAIDFSRLRNVASIVPFFSDAASSSAFSPSKKSCRPRAFVKKRSNKRSKIAILDSNLARR
jgi:hypothetical protein